MLQVASLLRLSRRGGLNFIDATLSFSVNQGSYLSARDARSCRSSYPVVTFGCYGLTTRPVLKGFPKDKIKLETTVDYCDGATLHTEDFNGQFDHRWIAGFAVQRR